MKPDHTCFIRVLNDPWRTASRVLDSVRESKTPAFLLSLGATMTSDVDGISAAGITPEARRMTPAVDAEILIMRRTVNGAPIPVSPAGIVSPVVITRACMELVGLTPRILDCGTFVAPGIETVTCGTVPAKCLSTGSAMDISSVRNLFERGGEQGKIVADSCDCIAIAECVPGGTTTAMAVLTSLGYDVRNLLSSSLPISNHGSRFQLVEAGMKNAGLNAAEIARDPLLCVASVGDPMQAFVAGLAINASQTRPVMLSGGSQMIAVYALAEAILKAEDHRQRLQQFRTNTIVVTTKWVALDQSANVEELAALTTTPFACSCPDFNASRHPGLKAYELGNVKEGVGAGGAMAMAHLIAGVSHEDLIMAIDRCYDELVVRQPCA